MEKSSGNNSNEAKERALAYYRAFAHRLRMARLTLDITETEAAAACLITLRTYRNWEAGRPFRGGHFRLVSFANKYDVSLDWLVCGISDGRPSPCRKYRQQTGDPPAKNHS